MVLVRGKDVEQLLLDGRGPGMRPQPVVNLANIELDVVVLPPQADEFTCVECFLVKHRSQLDHDTKLGPVCTECLK